MEKIYLSYYVTKKTQLFALNIGINKNRYNLIRTLQSLGALEFELINLHADNEESYAHNAQIISMIFKGVEVINQIVEKQETIAKQLKEELCKIYYENAFIRRFENSLQYNRLTELAGDVMQAYEIAEGACGDS